MTIDAHVDLNSLADPTGVYVWEEPLRLPHDRSLWTVSGEVRGNFPGFRHHQSALSQADVRLTSNLLGVESDDESFAIPTSAIQRVSLEAGSDRAHGAILSIDYVDAIAQMRRFWLKIVPRRFGILGPARNGLAGRWNEASIGELRLEPLVPGFRRMRPSGTNGDHASGDLWRTGVRVSLASGDESAELSASRDHVTLRCVDRVLYLPYQEIVDLVPLPSDPDSSETAVFLNFMDDDVLLSLRLTLDDQSSNARMDAATVLASLRDQGVRELAADDPLAFSAPSQAASGPTGLSAVEWAPDSTIGHSNGHMPGAEPTVVGQRSWAPGSAWSDGEIRKQRYAALIRHIVEEREIYQRLHAEQLLTDQDLEDHHRHMMTEIQTLHRLIQLNLLHDAGLIGQDEFLRTRHDLLNDLSIRDALTDGNE